MERKKYKRLSSNPPALSCGPVDARRLRVLGPACNVFVADCVLFAVWMDGTDNFTNTVAAVGGRGFLPIAVHLTLVDNVAFGFG
jgi:hypothetical protein